MKHALSIALTAGTLAAVSFTSANTLALDQKPASSAPTNTPTSASTPAAPASEPAPVRNTAKWNLPAKTKLAIDGYDPVSYFPEGGGKPAKGDAKFSTEYRGATYRFTSEAHRQAFLADPSKFEPAHGGWCSWAMREGDQVEVDPESFIVKDGRLFLFYNGWLGDTRAKWSKGDHAAFAKEADAQWTKLSGEKPHMSMPAMKPTPASPTAPTPAAASLNTSLKAIQSKFESGAPVAVVDNINASIKTVADSGITSKALAVGGQAPEFELPDIQGKTQSLKSMLAQGPVVVTFYRGSWCPFCSAQLTSYQDSLSEIKALGAQVVAISPQTMENSRKFAESAHLQFTVLSDAKDAVASKFGVSYAVPAQVAPLYRPMLAKANGNDSLEIPLAATYVLDRTGKVVYAYVNADYRQRAEPSEIIAALKSISKEK